LWVLAVRKLHEGLDFRGDRNPDYWDFFYFATSFGAASQTSDVSILTKSLRRLATLHAIISFSFNTAVLALAINLAASMILAVGNKVVAEFQRVSKAGRDG
jgi:uncharacterized membrane protein